MVEIISWPISTLLYVPANPSQDPDLENLQEVNLNFHKNVGPDYHYPRVEVRIQSDALSTILLGPALIPPGWNQNTIWCSIHYATGSSYDTPGLKSEYNLMLYPLCYWVQL